MSANSFPREVRLLTSNDFTKVFKANKRSSTSHLRMYTCVNTTGHARLGLIVPKRNIKNASNRNAVKRLMRESFRLNRHLMVNVDIIIMAYKSGGGRKLSPLNLRQELDALWQKNLATGKS